MFCSGFWAKMAHLSGMFIYPPVHLCGVHCISLFCFREQSSQKYNTAPEGCPVDWQGLMMVLGGAVMKEEDLY